VDCPTVDDRPHVLKSRGRKKQEKRGGIGISEAAKYKEHNFSYKRMPSVYPYNPTLFFPFRSVGGGVVVSVFKDSFAWDGRIQGFPDKYARSEARGRFIGKRCSHLTF